MHTRGHVRGARPKRVDANHSFIVKTFIKAGASVLDVHEVPGALDLLVGYAGVDQRVEVKDPTKPASRRNLTVAEDEVFDFWKGRTPVVVETELDVVELLGKMAKSDRRQTVLP